MSCPDASSEHRPVVPPELQSIVRAALDQALREYNMMILDQNRSANNVVTAPVDLSYNSTPDGELSKGKKRPVSDDDAIKQETKKICVAAILSQAKTPVFGAPDKETLLSKLSPMEKTSRNYMMKLQHFLNMEANEAIKSVFEFIADWGMNSAAGTVFVFPGPNSKGVDDTHSYNFTIGIHMGLMKIILDTFIAYFEDNKSFKTVRANVDKFVISAMENSGHFLFKEYADTLKVEFPDNLCDRFHLPIECSTFKTSDIVYLRINSFWDVMIALNKRSTPVPLEMGKLVELANLTRWLPGIIHVDHAVYNVKRESHLNLFEPLSTEQKTLLKKEYDTIFRRNPGEAKKVLYSGLLKKDAEYAKKIKAKENTWRLNDKTNQDVSKHWFSDQPVLSRRELTKHFRPDITCAVCKKDARKLRMVKTTCNHVFCIGCIANWITLEKHSTCPMCRAPALLPDVIALPKPVNENADFSDSGENDPESGDDCDGESEDDVTHDE
jgi:hypothetical protein